MVGGIIGGIIGWEIGQKLSEKLQSDKPLGTDPTVPPGSVGSGTERREASQAIRKVLGSTQRPETVYILTSITGHLMVLTGTT